MLLESFSDNEDFDLPPNKEHDTNIGNCSDSSLSELSTNLSVISLNLAHDDNTTEIRKLLGRKDELERRHRIQERNNQRLQVKYCFLIKKYYFILYWYTCMHTTLTNTSMIFLHGAYK